MRYDDPNVTTSAVIGVVGAILLFVIIVALQATFNRAEEAERQRKMTSQPYEQLAQLRAVQQEELNGYRWIDPKAKVVGIPIDRAMELVVAESSGSAPGSP